MPTKIGYYPPTQIFKEKVMYRVLIVSMAVLILSACSSLEFPWVYKISVQQGNILDHKDIDKLEIGMTKRQVQFVMGSPLLVDTFNPDRWDYFYSKLDGKGNVTQKRFTVIFEDDKYVRHEGDIEPNATSDEDLPTDELDEANLGAS